MFKYTTNQQIFDINGIKFGGQPGEYPTVVIGTFFYKNHNIVSDSKIGIFDKDKAEMLWDQQLCISDETGLNCMAQLVGETFVSLKKYIDWFLKIDQTRPIIVESSDITTRLEILNYINEIGVSNRIIYNSINTGTTKKEIEHLKNNNIKNAILLAFNPLNQTTLGKIEVLEGTNEIEGLLTQSKESCILHPLIDVAALPLSLGASHSIRSIIPLKSYFGLPTGGGFHNIASSWTWAKNYSKNKKEFFLPVDIGINLIGQIMGSNFLLYGPIENGVSLTIAASMVDIILEENTIELNIDIENNKKKYPISKLI